MTRNIFAPVLAPALALSLMVPVLAVPTSVSAQQQADNSIIVVADKYQRDWDKGHALELKGLAELEKAQRDLIKYTAEVDSAQNGRRNFDERSQNAQQEFRKLTFEMPSFTAGEAAEKWARDVRKAAEEWAKQDKNLSSGNNDFRKASREQEKAQDAVNKAETRIAEGRAMKATAERLSALQRGR